jgi:hypothetical protein
MAFRTDIHYLPNFEMDKKNNTHTYLAQIDWGAWQSLRLAESSCRRGPPADRRGGPAGPSCRSWGSCATLAAATRALTTPAGSTETHNESAVLRIYDILVRIRIRGSMPLTNGYGSGSGSCYFSHWPQDANKKLIFSQFFCLFLLQR